MERRKKLILIYGPTATGKSNLAVLIAKKFNGEIISSDSRQVYRGLNIGTGKITKKEMGGIPHHLLDIQNPKTRFTVVEFQRQAREKIAEIFSRGKLPILCGGTGFYSDAVTGGTIFPDVPPNLKLRKELSTKPAVELFAQLQKIDPRRAAAIDAKNSRRLIRAIEIATALGAVPHIETTPQYETLNIGLSLPGDILRERIHTRLLARVKKGMVSEARSLHKNGLSWKRMEELGLEYRYMARFLQKKITRAEMLSQLETEIWHYAKRQLTWFIRNKSTRWFSPTQVKEISTSITQFLHE